MCIVSAVYYVCSRYNYDRRIIWTYTLRYMEQVLMTNEWSKVVGSLLKSTTLHLSTRVVTALEVGYDSVEMLTDY